MENRVAYKRKMCISVTDKVGATKSCLIPNASGSNVSADENRRNGQEIESITSSSRRVDATGNCTISPSTLHNNMPLITLATQYTIHNNSTMGGQIITQLERDNLLLSL